LIVFRMTGDLFGLLQTIVLLLFGGAHFLLFLLLCYACRRHCKMRFINTWKIDPILNSFKALRFC